MFRVVTPPIIRSTCSCSGQQSVGIRECIRLPFLAKRITTRYNINKGIKIILTDSVVNVASATQINAVEISMHAHTIANSSGL